MSRSTNTPTDENIESFFFKWRQFLKDGIEQGNIPFQTQKALVDRSLDLLTRRDPVCEQLLKLGILHLDNEVETYVSPDEKALFQKFLTRVENGDLEI